MNMDRIALSEQDNQKGIVNEKLDVRVCFAGLL